MSELDIPDGAWLVRGGRKDELVTAFEHKGAIAVRWPDLGELPVGYSIEEFKTYLLQHAPPDSLEYFRSHSQELFYFATLMAVGDYVLTDDKEAGEVLVGRVTAKPEYNLEMFGPNYAYIRRIQWYRRVARNDFSAAAQKDLFSILSVYDVSLHLREIHKLVTGKGEDMDPGQVAGYNQLDGVVDGALSGLEKISGRFWRIVWLLILEGLRHLIG